jgi:hypothetical protein
LLLQVDETMRTDSTFRRWPLDIELAVEPLPVAEVDPVLDVPLELLDSRLPLISTS